MIEGVTEGSCEVDPVGVACVEVEGESPSSCLAFAISRCSAAAHSLRVSGSGALRLVICSATFLSLCPSRVAASIRSWGDRALKTSKSRRMSD